MASFASSATTGGARKHAWTSFTLFDTTYKLSLEECPPVLYCPAYILHHQQVSVDIKQLVVHSRGGGCLGESWVI